MASNCLELLKVSLKLPRYSLLDVCLELFSSAWCFVSTSPEICLHFLACSGNLIAIAIFVLRVAQMCVEFLEPS